MSMCPPEPPRQRIPKDGPGPRGAPDCYYTSRVLNSTFHYVKFVKRLRQEEADTKKGDEMKLKALQDQQNSDFFTRCDRRSLVNDVARRVELCLESYQEDLKQKRKRLVDLFEVEEEENIRMFVTQAQAGAEAIWQDKQNRLKYLVEKRKKEHEEKYKDTPLSRCVHVLPCIYKLRAKEAEEIQLYQIKEKQARKMAEKEFDKMWYEVAMKESDALAARMEQDTIERLRRDRELIRYTDQQLEENRLRREKEKELLKLETQMFRAMWDADIKKEEEAERQRTEKSMAAARDRKKTIEEQRANVARLQAEAKVIGDTWDALAGQGLADQFAEIELAKKKERDTVECNRKMIQLKNEIASMANQSDSMIEAEARRQQHLIDRKWCAYQAWAQKTNRDVRVAMVQQIKDRAVDRENEKKLQADRDEYQKQVHDQLEQLVAHKQLTDAQARKLHQNNLLEQIEYNKLLKERHRQAELEELKKCKLAAEEYEQEISRMLCRPFFSDDVNPFMKQMAKGLKMRKTCPCSKPDHCK